MYYSIINDKENERRMVTRIRCKLKNRGYNNTHDEIKRLFNVLSEYVNDGEYIKDKFIITGYDKIVHIILLPRRYAQNSQWHDLVV